MGKSAAGTEKLLNWLLDPLDPGPRYLALRDILQLPHDTPELREAQELAHRDGPIADLLSAMESPGYWEAAGPGYLPKYTSTVWSLILLAQLGASVHGDQRIERACQYYLDQACSTDGILSSSPSPSGTADCLQGNMCWALTRLGLQDEYLIRAFEWMARSVTGEGVAPAEQRGSEYRYYAGKCGPLFACGSNDRQSCAWGAVKVMSAFAVLPPESRTPLIERAINAGVEYLLGIDPLSGEYPHPYSAKPNGNWWKLSFPVFITADLLQLAEALTGLGFGQDPRLGGIMQWIREKQDADDRWALENSYHGKISLGLGEKKAANKWVTIRALRVLNAVEA